jgi:hypothetical protein
MAWNAGKAYGATLARGQFGEVTEADALDSLARADLGHLGEAKRATALLWWWRGCAMTAAKAQLITGGE